MEIQELTPPEYKNIFPDPYHVFNKVDFNLMNATARAEELKYLAFKSKKFKLGIIGNITNGKFRSPFSAPFGGFTYIKSDISLETLDACVDSFLEYCRSNKLQEIEIVEPPLFYAASFLSKVSNVLYRKGFTLAKSDLNFSIPLENNIETYSTTLQYNARKNLSISLTKNMSFVKCETVEEKELAYDVIRQNRESKGYPLRMTFENVTNTIKVIEADFFLVYLDSFAIASAMVFHVAKDVAQVVYWGDLPGFTENKTMNFLSFQVIEHYYKNKVKVLDIGPSTEDSIPNYGLCDFKESIGCVLSPKQTWTYKL